MKKLFDNKVLNDNSKLVGGAPSYTSAGSDTDMKIGYDVVHQTTNEVGKNGHWDTERTSLGTTDAQTVNAYSRQEESQSAELFTSRYF